AVLGVRDVAPARQLVALLSVLATTLAVGLADDRAVAGVRSADPARGQDQVDAAEGVLDAVRVVLDAAGVEDEARRRLAPHLGRLAERALGDARDLGGPRHRPRRAVGRHLVEADG